LRFFIAWEQLQQLSIADIQRLHAPLFQLQLFSGSWVITTCENACEEAPEYDRNAFTLAATLGNCSQRLGD
jgi:hypothetical protein